MHCLRSNSKPMVSLPRAVDWSCHLGLDIDYLLLIRKLDPKRSKASKNIFIIDIILGSRIISPWSVH
ncbi:hypothetical protein FRX31_023608 [Thalictrum thalictroides]|uniref:Uncharacterized protein n=1 Tax=Thalictrum thalictroides TaxID=46969 RepID=A0A7J6VQF8_THATH|nr:hypothetical protein FRX31_023608 [Thalictrum thalictroides]